MKLVGLHYATVNELIDDINEASLSQSLMATMVTARGFTALVRVSTNLSKALLKLPAAKYGDEDQSTKAKLQ